MRALLPLAFPLAFLLTAVLRPAAAQDVKVRASVDETTIGTEESVTYTLEVEGASFADVTTPSAPSTEGLVVLRPTPATQRNMTLINGQLRQSIAFQWSYRPLNEGTAEIRALSLTVKGETYRTEAIRITVVPQSQRPSRPGRTAPWSFTPPSDDDGDNRPSVSEQDLFIRAIPSARRAYQNEQVAIEYHLFFRNGIQLRQSRLAGSWDAEGFWREEMEVDTRPIPRTVIENGLRYNAILLKRVAVFPTRSGDLRIDPLKIETEALVPYRARDPFDQFFSLNSRFDTIELSSPPIRIDTRPLPENAPPSFAGAVGSFRLATRVDRTALEVGEALQYEVEVSGTGNLATLEAPALALPGAFEQYDPQVDVSIDRSSPRVSGRKTFTYLLVPRSNGTFELPAVRFSYFDPNAGTYHTLTSAAHTIRATGTGTPLATTATATGMPVDDIAGLLTAEPTWVQTTRPALHRRPWVYVALLLPLALVGAAAAARRHAVRLANDPEYARGRQAHPLARRYLKQAEAHYRANEPRAFYEALERSMLGFVGNRLNIAEHGLTRPQLDDRLRQAGVPDQVRRLLHDLLDACDRARFAPVLPSMAEMADAHHRAGQLLGRLDESLPRNGR